jgi:hypothetical protein
MKMLKLAVGIGLAGSTLAMLTSPAQAYDIVLSSPSPSPNPVLSPILGKYIFDYSLMLNPGESITPGETVTISNFAGMTGANVNPQAQSYFNSPDTTPAPPGTNNNSSTWTAYNSFTAPTTGTSINGFQIISQYGNLSGTANYSINNGGTTVASGTVVAATGTPINGVPEAKSSLAAVMALGFGYLYQRKLQKKGNFKP